MKNKIFLILTGFVFIFISSCTKDFDAINTNPNNPELAPIENVFAYTIKSVSSCFGTTEMETAAGYVGHVTKGKYTDITTYTSPPSSGVWNVIYRTTASNANFVISESKKTENFNLLGATMVLKVYVMQLATDIYGKVPYTEAGLGNDGIIYPAYDTEQAIYYDMLAKLDTANDLLINNPQNGIIEDGDLLYEGNITKWKKFCNSLHLRLAIRISNIDESKASSEISKIIDNPDKYPIFESNADNAFLAYPGGDWVEPWTAQHSAIGVDWMAKPIIDTLLNYSDPRIAFYADTLSDGTYIGLTVGEDATTTSYSRVNDLFVNNPTGSVFFLKYAEVEFIIAEAAKRGFISADAQTAYETAITASCEEYGISAGDISTYIAGSNVAWDDDINKIYIQKWISLFRQSWEAWAEMRRTDIPTLPPAANSNYSGHNRPPFRFPYPDSEVMLNSDNIPQDVNEDDNYWGYQIWWDTRTNVQ